jgi:hypothetical protein
MFGADLRASQCFGLRYRVLVLWTADPVAIFEPKPLPGGDGMLIPKQINAKDCNNQNW